MLRKHEQVMCTVQDSPVLLIVVILCTVQQDTTVHRSIFVSPPILPHCSRIPPRNLLEHI